MLLLEFPIVFKKRYDVIFWGRVKRKDVLESKLERFSRLSRNIYGVCKVQRSTRGKSLLALTWKRETRSSHSTSPYMYASAKPKSPMAQSLSQNASFITRNSAVRLPGSDGPVGGNV